MGITIKEIAGLCGVSVGTVDRALNDRPGISVKTKRKILKIAKANHYEPDHTAKSLASGRTMTIGVVLFDLYNRSFAQLTNAIEQRSREQGYFIHLTLTGKDRDNEKNCIQHLMRRKVDGLILFTVNQGAEFESYLESLNVPVVTICNRLSEQWPYIGIDDRQAMKDAVNYAWSKGYRNYVYVCPPLSYRGVANIFTQEERWQGCLEAVAEQKSGAMPTVIMDRNYLAAIDRLDLQENDDGKSVIVCSCDAYALEVLYHLKTKGIRVPEDVGVLGFDDIDVLKYVSPRLTTVKYDVEEFGIRSVDYLVRRLETGTSPPPPLLDYKIVYGESL